MNFDEDLGGTFAMDLPLKDREAESRASRLSTVERRVVKDSDNCVLCVANNDPSKVPVHSNCNCDVITDSVEAGVADSGSRFFNPLNLQNIAMEMIGEDDLPEAIQLDPGTVAIFDPENVRFGDLMRWLEQMQPVLQASNLYVSVLVDDDTDEAVEQVENVIDLLASDVDAGLEALQTKRFWFAIGKAMI